MTALPRKPQKFSGRRNYFAVNNSPSGVSTSYRVSGRLGELARRFMSFSDAEKDAKRLNRAYEMGYRHGIEFQQTAPAEFLESAIAAYIDRFKR